MIIPGSIEEINDGTKAATSTRTQSAGVHIKGGINDLHPASEITSPCSPISCGRRTL